MPTYKEEINGRFSISAFAERLRRNFLNEYFEVQEFLI